ncbi:MAG: hypothetical protein HRU12_10365 [Phaeodactylibacter sp.]|nr:hypothetical protein [Phaeodactylibacter sp.]
MAKESNFVSFPLHLLDAPYNEALQMIAGWGIHKLGCWKYKEDMKFSKMYDMAEDAAIELGLQVVSEYLRGDFAISFEKEDLLRGLEAARSHEPYYEGKQPPAPTIRLDLFFDACARNKAKIKERDFRIYSAIISITGASRSRKPISYIRLQAAGCGLKKGCSTYPVPESRLEYVRSEKVVRGAVNMLKKKELISTARCPSGNGVYYSHKLSEEGLQAAVDNHPRSKSIRERRAAKKKPKVIAYKHEDGTTEELEEDPPFPEQDVTFDPGAMVAKPDVMALAEKQALKVAERNKLRERLRQDVRIYDHPANVMEACYKHNICLDYINDTHYQVILDGDIKKLRSMPPSKEPKLLRRRR